MQEQNKNTLRNAIRKLPQYDPEDKLWDAISEDLEQSPSDDKLSKAIAKLPMYAPPDFVWENIEAELMSSNAATVRTLRWWKYAAAASVVLLAWFGVQQLWQPKQVLSVGDMQVSIGYSEETIRMPQATFVDAADDNSAFDLVAEVCRKKMVVCKDPMFKELLGELEELDDARQYLHRNVNDFDTDPSHKIQLARLERERSDVLKQMLKMI